MHPVVAYQLIYATQIRGCTDIERLGKHQAGVQPIDRRTPASLDNSTGSGFPERGLIALRAAARLGAA